MGTPLKKNCYLYCWADCASSCQGFMNHLAAFRTSKQVTRSTFRLSPTYRRANFNRTYDHFLRSGLFLLYIVPGGCLIRDDDGDLFVLLRTRPSCIIARNMSLVTRTSRIFYHFQISCNYMKEWYRSRIRFALVKNKSIHKRYLISPCTISDDS